MFRTVREQFLVEITGEPDVVGRHHVTDLAELNRLFTAWVETCYHRTVHSETGQTPLARWSAAAPVALPAPQALTEAFLWEEHRRVTKTATVSLHGNAYEVDPTLVGRKVELVFDPFDLTRVEVRLAGTPMGPAIPHRIGRHSHPKAKPETPSTPPKPSGIDYAQLIETAHAAELARGVNSPFPSSASVRMPSTTACGNGRRRLRPSAAGSRRCAATGVRCAAGRRATPVRAANTADRRAVAVPRRPHHLHLAPRHRQPRFELRPNLRPRHRVRQRAAELPGVAQLVSGVATSSQCVQDS